MKYFLIAICTLLGTRYISAATFYEQLCEFNFNWKAHAIKAPTGKARIFTSDRDYVQAHLESVLPILRAARVGHLNVAQYRSRLYLIGLLDHYRQAGSFPLNYCRKERIPVFIDEHGTHCAVGYLMQQTGHEELALRIAMTDNYAWVKDIRDPELPTWQEASGFSLDELKLIQGAYDFYMENALFLPNRFEIPQKPECILVYFEGKPKKPENIWCQGEGKNGVLNGRWEQYATPGMPWIIGYYEQGKRSGQWAEYYQGTQQLCRTENWRNDQLNGVRRRYDRTGRLIEEILFKDGNAVSKTNHDFTDSLTWVRKPIDSTHMWTQVYTTGGALIATGQESVHNPGNLKWFQNIELTALNSFAISARDDSDMNGPGGISLYNTPPLVEYRKEGKWTFYKEYTMTWAGKRPASFSELLRQQYRHFGPSLHHATSLFDSPAIGSGYDSICAVFAADHLMIFFGYGTEDYLHLLLKYYENDPQPVALHQSLQLTHSSRHRYRRIQPSGATFSVNHPVREIGQYNRLHQKTGTWKYYDRNGTLYKIEQFLVPRDEDEEANVR